MLSDKICFACRDFVYGNNVVVLCHQCDRHIFYCKDCDGYVRPGIDHLNSTLACRRCKISLDLESEPAPPGSVADSWKLKIGINGFGRMGKSMARAILRSKDALLVCINDPFIDMHDMANEFNLNAGQHELKIQDYDTITFGVTPVTFSHIRNPKNISWDAMGVKYVVDCTGVFTNKSNAESHLKEAATKVIVTSHSDDVPMYVVGVNEENYDPTFEAVVSTTSTLTNCIAPLAKVINSEFGIMEGFMTVHSATHKTVDVWTGSRAACGNIISCTSSQDAEAVGSILPALKGKFIGTTSRAPTVDVSVVDLTVKLERVNYEDIKVLIKQKSEGHLKGIIGYVENDAVAENFVGDCRSCIFDSKASMAVNDKFVKLVAWFDNEWSYSSRILDLMRHMQHIAE